MRMSNPQSSSPPLLRTTVNDVNANMAPKSVQSAVGNPMGLRPDSSARKLIRSESTFGEDIFDESLHELSQLNQRHVLRQQWFRKNNLVSRLRRSTSTASNSSSSSSSGISSGVYSNCSANTSSFASSFSSSFATLSSLSESCDTTDPTNPVPSAESDYPRIIRRSSFKNKFSNCYKPYYKPRRLSLQILKGQMELPENFKFYSSKAYLFDLNSQAPVATHYPINPDKENSALYSMAAAAATKSNPASPNKSITYVPEEGCMAIAEGELPSSMQAQIVITNSSTSSGSSQPVASNNGQVLVRSKSLDDLNTLFCYSNACPCAGPDNSLQVSPMVGAQQSASHYSSFNRIFCDFSKLTIDHEPHAGSESCATSPQLFFGSSSSSGPPSHMQTLQLLPPTEGLLGVNSQVNNLKGMSFSSHEISNAGNQPQPLNSSTTNTSLCDIDNVMKKISSLRV